jgi:hypothetical protein
MAGLVPAIPLRRALCSPRGDGRDKPGHDAECFRTGARSRISTPYGLTQTPLLPSPVPTKASALVSTAGAGTMAIMSGGKTDILKRAGALALACISVVEVVGTSDFITAIVPSAVRVAVAITRADFLNGASCRAMRGVRSLACEGDRGRPSPRSGIDYDIFGADDV